MDAPTDQPDDRPVLLFDGVCGLCSRGVRFVRRHERPPGVRCVPMQTDEGRALLGAHGFDPEAMSSLVFIEGGRAQVRSRGVLALCRHLRRPWRWARALGVLPRPLLDALYGFTARHRYRLFGMVERCEIGGSEP